MWSDALAGGLLIGLSAVLLMAGLGRVAGISGVSWQAARQLFQQAPGDQWRYWFFAGLAGGGGLVYMLGNSLPPAVPDTSFWQVIAAGFLVGFGAHLGSGCTSGHGVCGLGRLSLRSLVATLIFLLAAVITVYLLRLSRGG